MPCQLVELQVNWYFEISCCTHYNSCDDDNRDGPWNVALLAVQPPDAAASSRRFCSV